MKHVSRIIFAIFLLISHFSHAQSTFNLKVSGHSHNDYLQEIPFWEAYHHGMSSIEADVFLREGQLFVAHTENEINPSKTFESLYLKPAVSLSNNEDGSFNAENRFILLIDIKSDAKKTLTALVKLLEPHQNLFYSPDHPSGIQVVISGNRPEPNKYEKYPDFVYFDGRLTEKYNLSALSKVAMISEGFTGFSKWNGKGRPVTDEEQEIRNAIEKAHSLGKPMRFWATPDTKTSWLTLTRYGVDFIGTDHPVALESFLKNLSRSYYQSSQTHELYHPTYVSDGADSLVKNIILVIGDGFGLAQMQAALTANRDRLNLVQFKYTGLSRTSSSDNYHTDSAAGANALSTGKKTRNRYIGMDPEGEPLRNIPELVESLGMKSGIISTSDLTDATPAAFFAHNTDRGNTEEIAIDLLNSPLTFVAGDGIHQFDSSRSDTRNLLPELKEKGFEVFVGHDEAKVSGEKRTLLFAGPEDLKFEAGKGKSEQFLQTTTDLALTALEQQDGFFLMIEAAQIDWGGHSNDLTYLVEETLAMDKLIGKLLEYVDKHPETLLLVTADHETGGLTLMDGDESQGIVVGEFSTNDHTGIMVPVYAYGPHSDEFSGIYENTEIFSKMMRLLERDNDLK